MPSLIDGLRPARDAVADRGYSARSLLRRIATRYDKLARNFLAALALAAIRVRIRHYESTT